MEKEFERCLEPQCVDHRYDTISAQGFPYVDTPNLDRLIQEGVCFTNNFVASASCGPSRARLFKGYYPHTTGIYRNAEIWQHSWIENLVDAGYYCVNIGKCKERRIASSLAELADAQ